MTKLPKILCLALLCSALTGAVLPDNQISSISNSECLTVYNRFSYSSHKIKNVFFVECAEQYPNNYLQVYNRWGTKVFEMKGYDNSWNGSSTGIKTMGAKRKLPIGTYYYDFDLGDASHHKLSGWLYISK